MIATLTCLVVWLAGVVGVALFFRGALIDEDEP